MKTRTALARWLEYEYDVVTAGDGLEQSAPCAVGPGAYCFAREMIRGAALLVACVLAVVACGAGSSGSSSGSSSSAPPSYSQGSTPRQAPPDHVVGGFTIQLPAFTLQPGDEQFPCYIFPLDLQGPSHLVGGAQVQTQPGMHHGNVTTRPSTGTGFRPCPAGDQSSLVGGEALDILAGGAVLFASSTQHTGTEWQSPPTGMAYPITDGFEIVARMHYLNASTNPVTVSPTYQWYTVDESTVTQVLAPFIWVYSDFSIAPGQTLTVEGDCTFPPGMKIALVLPHMHKLGTAFTAGFLGGPLDKQPWLESKGYDPGNGVMRVYDPPLDLSQGDGASFSCTWFNSTDQTVVEGVGNNEMCMLFGYGFPAASTFTLKASAATDKCLYVASPQGQ